MKVGLHNSIIYCIFQINDIVLKMEAPIAGRLIGESTEIVSPDSRERRRGSGSFMGAEESDEEIAFRGSTRDRLGEFATGKRISAIVIETFLRPQALMVTRDWTAGWGLSPLKRKN